jgi:hypothetical protein
VRWQTSRQDAPLSRGPCHSEPLAGPPGGQGPGGRAEDRAPARAGGPLGRDRAATCGGRELAQLPVTHAGPGRLPAGCGRLPAAAGPPVAAATHESRRSGWQVRIAGRLGLGGYQLARTPQYEPGPARRSWRPWARATVLASARGIRVAAYGAPKTTPFNVADSAPMTMPL